MVQLEAARNDVPLYLNWRNELYTLNQFCAVLIKADLTSNLNNKSFSKRIASIY